MVASNKSFGKSTLAGLFAVAALASAVPAFASTNTTVTWNFNSPASWSNRNSNGTGDIGTSATFTGTETPLDSLGAPLSTDLGITAYGYLVPTEDSHGTITYNYSYRSYHNHKHQEKTAESKAYNLYNKDITNTPSEQGLGLVSENGMADNEISDTTPSSDWRGNTYYDTGVVQLDISNLLNLLGYANNNNASITIGSLQSPDTAIISASTSLGVIGTQIATVASIRGGADQSTTISLSELKNYTYLNVTAAAAGQAGQGCQPGTPGQTVLLSTLSLNLPSDSGNPTPAAPAPVPASAGLTLAGALGMGMMLLARRRRSML